MTRDELSRAARTVADLGTMVCCEANDRPAHAEALQAAYVLLVRAAEILRDVVERVDAGCSGGHDGVIVGGWRYCTRCGIVMVGVP